jgi:hypothetical protein
MTRNTYVPYVEMLNQNQQNDQLILRYVTFMNVYTKIFHIVLILFLNGLPYTPLSTIFRYSDELARENLSLFKYCSLIMFVNYLVVGFLMYSLFKYSSLIKFVNYLVVGFLMYNLFKYSSLIMFVSYLVVGLLMYSLFK